MTIILTSDHGSVLCQNPSKISSRHELTSGLRLKEGIDIIHTPDSGFLINEPKKYRLPDNGSQKNYILATGDNYLVYETSLIHIKRYFREVSSTVAYHLKR